MKFVTFRGPTGDRRPGVLLEGRVLDLAAASNDDPRFASLQALLEAGPEGVQDVEEMVGKAQAAEPLSVRCLYELSEVSLVAPIPRPRKNVYCVGLNYRSHVEQNAAALGLPVEIPDVPLFFSKPVTAIVGPEEGIVLDERLTSKLDYEVELALVVGRRGSWIPEEEASSHIFGYTLINDVSARDLQWRTTQMFYGKGLDTFSPMGPAVVTAEELDARDQLLLELRVNGEVRQREAAGFMIFSPERVIAELSKGITLEPGDVISLGTPGGCGYQMSPPRFLAVGDTVECHAKGIGTLRNRVVRPAES